MNNNNDTIFALSTPLGKSAIAVIRISGPNSYSIVSKLSINMPKKAKNATLNKIILENKLILDHSVTTFFKSPKSYTGEDMVEISIHGGSAIIKKLLSALGNIENTRMAEPGEFTRRAFINNKLDLTQVEAVADLVNSETEAQRKQAIRQLDGGFSKQIKEFSKKIMNILANTEALIDFSDEELPNDLRSNIIEQIENIINEINIFINEGSIGEKIRSGFIIPIIGRPNTGKSSFINNIAKRDIAIVTNEPGTTRDSLELFVDFKGMPVKFYDTAGLRPHTSKAEEMGIKKTYNLSDMADINLVFIDNEGEIHDYEKKMIKNTIYVKSKTDILKKIKNKKVFNISSATGDGFNKLFEQIYSKINPDKKEEDYIVSRERHRITIKKTLKHLKNSKKNKNIDIFAEDIRQALKEISKITGNVDIEDVLEIIFNDFCIGK